MSLILKPEKTVVSSTQNCRPLEILVSEVVAIAFVSQVAEGRGIDRIGNGAHRAVGEECIEAAGMGSTEEPIAVAEFGAVVRGGRAVGMPDRVGVPARRVALIVVGLLPAQVTQIQS